MSRFLTRTAISCALTLICCLVSMGSAMAGDATLRARGWLNRISSAQVDDPILKITSIVADPATGGGKQAIGTQLVASGPMSGGTAVTITGQGFAPVGRVRVDFGGVPATSHNSIGTSELIVTTPDGPFGAVPVTLSNLDEDLNPANSITANPGFFFNTPDESKGDGVKIGLLKFFGFVPEIEGIEVGLNEVLLAGAGDSVQLQVRGILSNGSRVDLSSAGSGTAYVFDPPGVASVDGDGVVTGLHDGTTTLMIANGPFVSQVIVMVATSMHVANVIGFAEAFQIMLQPRLYAVRPVRGRAGEQVRLEGVGFSETPSQNGVRFSTGRAQVLTATSTVLEVIIPANGASGPVTVEVEGQVSQGVPFNYISEPLRSGRAPRSE